MSQVLLDLKPLNRRPHKNEWMSEWSSATGLVGKNFRFLLLCAYRCCCCSKPGQAGSKHPYQAGSLPGLPPLREGVYLLLPTTSLLVTSYCSEGVFPVHHTASSVCGGEGGKSPHCHPPRDLLLCDLFPSRQGLTRWVKSPTHNPSEVWDF
jgi:hypothetical protein